MGLLFIKHVLTKSIQRSLTEWLPQTKESFDILTILWRKEARKALCRLCRCTCRNKNHFCRFSVIIHDFMSYLRSSKSSEGSIWLDVSLTTVTSHVNLGYIVSVVSKKHAPKIGNQIRNQMYSILIKIRG